SLDAVGALPSMKHMQTFIQMFSTNPKMNEFTIAGDYQTIAVIPLGAAYVIVNDRKIDSIEKAAGKKVAVLEWDKSQARMVQQLGAQPVASDITNFAGKFNNGQVDIIAAPALAFKPLELYRGLGTKGAIYRMPLVQVTGSVMIRRAKFVKEVPDFDKLVLKLRQYAVTKLPTVYNMIDKSEKEIDARYWLDLPTAEKQKYERMMREARMQLTREGVYDPKMMAILKKVRCKLDPANFECALKDE
ncbi:MAG TPA: putative solute-binding protein, partial [Candidatus Kapabacteria bacterium]|nr:putative solute-binding protein [Candidatus Kapabacteria bacterium]